MGKVQGHRRTMLPFTAVHRPRHEASVAMWVILAVALDTKSGRYVNTAARLRKLLVSQAPSSSYMALSWDTIDPLRVD